MPRIWVDHESDPEGRTHRTSEHLLHRIMARDWLLRHDNAIAAAQVDLELDQFRLRGHVVARSRFAVWPPVTRLVVYFPALKADALVPTARWYNRRPYRAVFVLYNHRGITVQDLVDRVYEWCVETREDHADACGVAKRRASGVMLKHVRVSSPS